MPSNIETTSKEQVKAITLRSKKQVKKAQEISKEAVAGKRPKQAWRSKTKASYPKASSSAKEQPQIRPYVPRFFLKGLEGIN